MTVKISELMAKRVITAAPHHTVEHVRGMMERNRIHAVPVVGTNGEPVGIVTTADLSRRVKDESPVSRIMSDNVTVMPAYNDATVAARIMRKRRIHHVVVTHEKQVIGIISSFDLLKLVEGHRFVAKAAPTSSKRASKRT
ncbi:MAG: CBS domain-containing protein [Phycisphaerae bacterium]|nr:CBS domain-containing protein [Phycisphaerae bacterium]